MIYFGSDKPHKNPEENETVGVEIGDGESEPQTESVNYWIFFNICLVSFVHGGLELRETGVPFYDDVLVAMFVMGF